jgi:hypothetical protein
VIVEYGPAESSQLAAFRRSIVRRPDVDAAYLKWRGTELEMLNPKPALENGPPSGVSGLMIMVFEGPCRSRTPRIRAKACQQ